MTRLALIFACLPVAALAADVADSATPGAGAGVWAMAGAFLGQLAASRIFVRREVSQGITAHEAACRLRSLSPEK